MDRLKEFVSAALTVVFWLALVGAWWTAVFSDASENKFGWLVFNLVMPPLGVLRGIAYWIGLA